MSYTIEEKIKIIDNTIILWTDIVKHNLRRKEDSEYYYLVENYDSQCGLCEIHTESCITCPLDFPRGCKYYEYPLSNPQGGWYHTKNNKKRLKYAHRILWTIRRFRKELENEK